jgi:Protein O-mannosyl-transferase TMEM260-like
MFIFFSVFTLYLVALCPTIYVGDSSVLTAAAFSLGTAHPPGYPLYVLLGKLFTFLPLGNVAFKVNLMNAFFGGLTGYVVFRATDYLTENRYAAWTAALFLATVPVFWVEAIKAEVYTLNAFIASLIFLLTVRLVKGDGNFYRQSFLIAFLAGIGAGNHHTISLMGLAALPVFLMRWRELRLRWVIFMAVFLLMGISVYFLVYTRSLVEVTTGIAFLYSYGGSVSSLIDVFLRKAYKVSTVSALEGTSHIFSNLFAAVRSVLEYLILPNIRYSSLPFIFLGFFRTLRDRKLIAYYLSLFFFWIVFLGNMVTGGHPTEENIQIVDVYFMPLFPILSVILGVGVAYVLKKAEILWRESFVPKFLAYSALAFPLCLLPQAYGFAAPIQYPLAYTYARDMLTTLPVRSMILHYNDNPTFTTFYMQSVEKFRDDVLEMCAGGTKDNYGIETAPAWKFGVLYPRFYWTQEVKVSYLDREFASRGKLFTSNPKSLTRVLKKHYSFKIIGLTAELFPKGAVPGPDVIDESCLRADKFLNFEMIRNLPRMDDFLAVELVNHYSLSLLIYGDTLARHGDPEGGRKAMLDSISLGDPKAFLGPYIKYLMNEGRVGEGLAFLRELERNGDVRDRAVANILEYKVLSVTGHKEEAARKLEYIERRNLRELMDARF